MAAIQGALGIIETAVRADHAVARLNFIRKDIIGRIASQPGEGSMTNSVVTGGGWPFGVSIIPPFGKGGEGGFEKENYQ